MNGILENLGITEVFSDKADFSPLSNEMLKLSKVAHEAAIDIDEEGTRAAAVTGMFAVGSGIPSEIVEMDINTPCFFALRDRETKALLFVGRVLEPTPL